jgi:hypothetical protein
MYGSDICAEARRRGKKCYAISAFCIHNTSTTGGLLPLQFWKCYLFMRRKWKDCLPIETPCTRISSSCWPIIHWHSVFVRNLLFGRNHKATPVSDPSKLYRELLAHGVIRPDPMSAEAPASAQSSEAIA